MQPKKKKKKLYFSQIKTSTVNFGQKIVATLKNSLKFSKI